MRTRICGAAGCGDRNRGLSASPIYVYPDENGDDARTRGVLLTGSAVDLTTAYTRCAVPTAAGIHSGNASPNVPAARAQRSAQEALHGRHAYNLKPGGMVTTMASMDGRPRLRMEGNAPTPHGDGAQLPQRLALAIDRLLSVANDNDDQ